MWCSDGCTDGKKNQERRRGNIVLVNGQVKVDYDERHRCSTCALLRTQCSITTHKWKYVPLNTEFDIDSGVSQMFDINSLWMAYFKEWMFELRNYYVDQGSRQQALNNPPNEFEDRREQWHGYASIFMGIFEGQLLVFLFICEGQLL
ncbi:hypothetical protein D8674_021604 [Pyrus ussuriensis x Pyrus communis]|uniref:Uncharacterized protein n=1 Tax=Pyrus ussuriensis x Pyrus communis TaxID=2448454 RepID=A0A5N5GHJ6_9ROSA|nr:hypothetical protein D8674_021604 [Pyrus ussuriensis x Pyrus communis]